MNIIGYRSGNNKPVPFRRRPLAPRTALFLLAAFSFTFLQISPSSIRAQSEEKKEKIAVLDLEGVGASQVEAVALTERLREMLLKTGRFTMVDRSQMEAILDEQALQQLGCAGKDCVVEVGRILGVTKIVTGKAVKVNEGMWLISAMMVDVQTAETLALESIRHRGDLFALMEGGIPGIALRLSSPAPTESAADAAPATPAQPSGETSSAAAPLKVAIFPARLEGEYAGKLERDHHSVVGGLEKYLKNHPEQVVLTHSFYPTRRDNNPHENFKALSNFEEAREKSWEGFFVKTPNDRFIFQSAKKMGVDLVLLYKANAAQGGVREYEVYLYDVNNFKVYQRAGRWKKKTWGRTMVKAVKKVFKKFRREQ